MAATCSSAVAPTWARLRKVRRLDDGPSAERVGPRSLRSLRSLRRPAERRTHPATRSSIEAMLPLACVSRRALGTERACSARCALWRRPQPRTKRGSVAMVRRRADSFCPPLLGELRSGDKFDEDRSSPPFHRACRCFRRSLRDLAEEDQRTSARNFGAGIGVIAIAIAFGVRRSAFGVRRSAFGVRRSAFGVRRSAFGVGTPRDHIQAIGRPQPTFPPRPRAANLHRESRAKLSLVLVPHNDRPRSPDSRVPDPLRNKTEKTLPGSSKAVGAVNNCAPRPPGQTRAVIQASEGNHAHACPTNSRRRRCA